MSNKLVVGIFGASGFIGSTICKEVLKSGHSVIAFSRSEQISNTDKLDWKRVDPHDNGSYKEILQECDSLVISIGTPPLPTFSTKSFEEQIKNNGQVCQTIIDTARESEIKKIVLISASMPKWAPIGYREGKRIALEAAKEFVANNKGNSATVLYPAAVNGTRKAGNIPIPLWLGLTPMAFAIKILRRFRISDSLESLSPYLFKGILEPPVNVSSVAQIAAKAAIDITEKSAFKEISNGNIMQG